MDGIGSLAAMARPQGLVVVAGAGISMLAPASLPNWRDFNRAVIDALAHRAGLDTNPGVVADFLTGIVNRRETERAYAPDFMAQLIEEEVGADYFGVLQVLDSEAFNHNHLLLATLARAGAVRAIVTTNFDRLIERALDACSVPYRVFASAEEFEQLEAALADGATALPLIKAHGSVERPQSMVDTLAQRVRGRPKALNRAIASLFARHAVLMIGFSGADLAYDEEYLGLRSASATARALTVLVRSGEPPLPALAELLDEYGPRATVLQGTLPEVLLALTTALDVEAPDPPGGAGLPTAELQARLALHTAQWVDRLQPMSAINAFVALVDASRDLPGLLQFMVRFRRDYRTEKHTVDAWYWSVGYWRFEYRFARRLLDVGRLVHTNDDDGDSQRLLPGYPHITLRRDEDAMQRLANLRNRGHHAFEAHAALAEFTFWHDGPGRAVAAARQAMRHCAATEERAAAGPRAAIDMALSISRVFEWSGEYAAALDMAKAAIIDAGQIGDEPRRAEALVQLGRALACSSMHDDARRAIAQARRVSDRLAIERLDAAVCGAQGMLAVIEARDAEALEPLQRACGHYRGHQRRPMLLVSLLDLARAAFYTSDPALTRACRLEVCDLCDELPGGQGPMLVMECELFRHQANWDHLRAATDDLELVCRQDAEFPWTWGLGRVERQRKRLAENR